MENVVRTEGMYEYTVRFGEATIVRHLREYDFEKHDTVIPAYLGSYPVVEIGRAAFQEQYMIGSVTVPEGVRVIGGGAFADSNRITEIKLPRTLERIEGGAFSSICLEQKHGEYNIAEKEFTVFLSSARSSRIELCLEIISTGRYYRTFVPITINVR